MSPYQSMGVPAPKFSNASKAVPAHKVVLAPKYSPYGFFGSFKKSLTALPFTLEYLATECLLHSGLLHQTQYRTSPRSSDSSTYATPPHSGHLHPSNGLTILYAITPCLLHPTYTPVRRPLLQSDCHIRPDHISLCLPCSLCPVLSQCPCSRFRLRLP